MSKKTCFECRRIKKYEGGVHYGAGSWMCDSCLKKIKEEEKIKWEQ